MRQLIMDKRRIVGLLLLLLCCGMIFFFSAQPAKESEKMSTSVGMTIGRIVVPGFEKCTVTEQETFAEKIDFEVRKCAHMTEYAILGALFFINYSMWNIRGVRGALFAIGSGAVYAVTDEIHQLYVPGRSGEIRDVFIDSIGATLGVCFIVCICWMVKKRKKNGSKIS